MSLHETLAAQAAPVQVTCPVTGVPINRDDSHRFGVGFSHYVRGKNGQWTRSYNQVFNTLHCATRDAAKKAVKARIEAHANIPFGNYDAALHNPSEEHAHHVCRQNVEYNTDGMLPPALLPKSCAVCGSQLDANVYVPHVDDSTRGTHYQGILQKQYPNASLEQLTFGACSLEHAQKLAHAILDEVIEPDYQASQA